MINKDQNNTPRYISKYIMITMLLSLIALTANCIVAPMHRQNLSGNPLSYMIDSAVFEVIIPKPKTDTVTYEKELPLDLLPFSVRNDEYYSIGTAFCVGSNRFISAAHVIQLIYKSQFENYYLRGKDKKIYEIDKVFRYSTSRDFIIFSVKGGEDIKTAFKLDTKPAVNTPIYAVGNAFGEGIIMRQGFLTSMTPEEENGEWQWLRFSAAASPGNSGGPLLDAAGNVIGIVVRKSENENLNFALPVSEIESVEKNRAVDHQRFMYSLLNTMRKKVYSYDYSTTLPLQYHELRENLLAGRDIFLEKIHNEFLDSFRKSFFPEGKGANEVLHYTNTSPFPGLICEDKNEEWGIYYPKTKSMKLGKGGYIQAGVIGNIVFLKTRNPDGVTLMDIMENPDRSLDQILKAVPTHRTIMGNDIRITSYGKPAEKIIYEDKFKRKWVVSSWYTKYDDTKLLTFTTPTPDGTFTMMSQTSTSSDYMIDLKYLTDFIQISYSGTFHEWKKFLSLGEYLPGIFRTVKFKYKKNYKALYKSKNMYIKYQNSLQKISKDSIMILNFAYFKEKGRLKWDINEVIIGEDKNNSTYFYISKQLKPEKGLGDEYFAEWKKLQKREYPYNKTPYTKEKAKIIKTVCREKKKKSGYLYTMGFIYDGKIGDADIKNKLNTLDSSFKYR